MGVASGNAAGPTTHTAVTAAPLQPRPLSPRARSTIATPPQCQRHRHWESVGPVERRVIRGTTDQGWSDKGRQKQGTGGVGVGAGVQGGGEERSGAREGCCSITGVELGPERRDSTATTRPVAVTVVGASLRPWPRGRRWSSESGGRTRCASAGASADYRRRLWRHRLAPWTYLGAPTGL